MQNIPTTYDQGKEKDIYKLWELSGYFNPDNLEGEPYTIIMPPPNANAPLHVGHVLFLTVEDIIIRYQRMRGKKTLWLPGTDHAGFETQVVFEKKLEKEGRSRFKMQRDEFFKEAWEFVQNNKHVTEEGIKRLGASCDWSRNIFTLDPQIIEIVYRTFKKMADDGLVYRGNRIANWCTKHQTALSDLETKYEERDDKLYYIKYGPFTLATTRPETKFGDTAIAVHPEDERYKEYVGREIEVEGLLGQFKITVVADELVDKEFGTGAVKVTPAHDAVDFEIWQKHKDEIPGPLPVIDKFGRLDLSAFGNHEAASRYQGLKVKEAREKVVSDLIDQGLMEKIDEHYNHNVQLCYKCGTVIEPIIVPQWYVAMTKPLPDGRPSLRDMAVTAVEKKDVVIMPEHYEKIFMHWMETLRDWPISRQIWWGIPIPVKYCTDCGESIVDTKDEIKDCPNCQSKNLEKDPDTFDTWFSSGQWPYAALEANSIDDLNTFYPTQVMETAYDILFFWVARMIMMGSYTTGKAPFKHVYLHGLVRDKNRQKMSKSKGNVIDPVEVVDKYGVDALRMALIVGNLPGNDSVISDEKIKGYRNFANKIWNVARFILQATDDYKPSQERLLPADQKIIDELTQVAASITKRMESFDYAHAAEDLYHYLWHTLADKIIEESKQLLTDEQTRPSRQAALIQVLDITLRLLHPFVPFVTEAVWQLYHKELLMAESWPVKE